MPNLAHIKSEVKEVLSAPLTRTFLFISFIMLLVEYFGWQRPFYTLIAPSLAGKKTSMELKFLSQVYTTSSFLLFFVILPFLFLPLIKGKESISYGLKVPPFKAWSPYLIIAGFMFIVLALVCNTPQFYKFYPLYRPNSFSDWLLFECVYMPQFFAVEFFFRGPLLYLLNKLSDKGAEAMMTLPYCLIHIHKPFPEAVGSIFAGLVLSRLSLKQKSIVPGIAIHMFVALSADFFGLYYSGAIARW